MTIPCCRGSTILYDAVGGASGMAILDGQWSSSTTR